MRSTANRSTTASTCTSSRLRCHGSASRACSRATRPGSAGPPGWVSAPSIPTRSPSSYPIGSTMADIELKTLLGRLNRTSTRALEAAAGWCVSRGNYEISVEHLLHELVQHGGSDVALIVAHYEVDAAKLKRGLLEVLEDQRTGNPGRPVFSPLLVEWFQ